MNKHINIFIEGKLNSTDFNFYSQTGAWEFNINAVYKNGDSVHVDIEAEGSPENLSSYVEFLKNGPLEQYILSFRTEEAEFVGISGFTSHKVHKDEIGFKDKLRSFFGIK